MINENRFWVMRSKVTAQQLQGLIILVQAAGLKFYYNGYSLENVLQGIVNVGWTTTPKSVVLQEGIHHEDIFVTYEEIVEYLQKKIKQNANSHSI